MGITGKPDAESLEEKPGAFFACVRGKVQGVGFRYSAVRTARRLGINGYVRNASDGSVEVWAEGAQRSLDSFLAWLHKGPEFSRIDSVDKQDRVPQGCRDFDVEY
jgi:acylphosphatase